MSLPDPKALKAQCDTWNKKHPVGTMVKVDKDCKETIETKTRSAAEVLGGHTAVIWLEGFRGCYALSRVTAIE